jgi:myo-inositol catabolism protein IolS
MRYQQFGSLDFEVSLVGFGAASISGPGGGYGFGHITEPEAMSLVHRAQDLGINLFDTAPIYGFGMSEQRLGRALAGARRDKAFIVSKCGITWDNGQRVSLDNSAVTTRGMIEQSLRDLDTEMIDLYLVHWPDANVDIRETFEVLVRAQEEGKLRYIGLSNTTADEIAKASEIGVVSVCQAQDSFFHSVTRDSLFDTFSNTGTGFMSWGTLEKGILTGRAKPDRVYDDKDVRNHAPWWTSVDHTPFYETMDQVLPFLIENGHTGVELALGHAFSSSVLSTALCGARTPEQIDGLIAAVDNLPTAELLEECHRIRKEVFLSHSS